MNSLNNSKSRVGLGRTQRAHFRRLHCNPIFLNTSGLPDWLHFGAKLEKVILSEGGTLRA